MIETQTKKNTYIMQGLESKKELDIYHLILAPTFACNMQCKHCYLPNHKPEYLPEDVALKLVDEWSEIVLQEKGRYNGIFHIKGGEPFVIPYFWKLAHKVASKKAIQLMLTTNGTFYDSDIIDRLVSLNDEIEDNLKVIVSLDGATEQSNSKLRGKGHFLKVIKLLKNLKNSGLCYFLNCVLHKGNIAELQNYIDLAKTYNASQLNFLNFIPRENAVDIENWQVPHLRVYKTFSNIFMKADDETKLLLTGSLPELKFNEDQGYLSISNECVAGYKGLLYILPNGDAFTCPNVIFYDDILGNVYNSSLEEIMTQNTQLQYKLESFSGKYQCTGERKLYLQNKDLVRLNSLNEFSDELNSNIPTLNKVSFCYNRNF